MKPLLILFQSILILVLICKNTKGSNPCFESLDYSEQFVFTNLDSCFYFTLEAANCFMEEGNLEYYLSCKAGLCNILYTHKKFDKFINLCAELELESVGTIDSNHIVNLEINNTLGNYYRILGKYEKSQRFFEKALRLCIEKSIGDKVQSIFHHNLGVNLLEKGDLTRANRHCELSLKLKSELPSTHIEIGHIYELIGNIHLANLDFLEGAKYLEKALKIFEINNAKSIVIDLRLKISQIYSQLNYHNKALSMQENIDPLYKKNSFDSLNIDLCLYTIRNRPLNADEIFNIFQEIKKMSVPFVRKTYFLNLGMLIIKLSDKNFLQNKSYKELYRNLSHESKFETSFTTKTIEFLFKDLEYQIRNENVFEIEKFQQINHLMDVAYREVGDIHSKKKISKLKVDFQELVLGQKELELSEDLILQIFDLNKAYSLDKVIEMLELRKMDSDDVKLLRDELDIFVKDNRILYKELSNLDLNSDLFYNKNLTFLRNKNIIDSLENIIFKKASEPRNQEKESLTVLELQRSLDPSELVIVYVQSDSTLHRLLVSSDDFKVISKPMNKSMFNNLSNELINSIVCHNTDTEFYAHEIRKELFDDLNGELEKYDKLIFVPDGILNKLPFKFILKEKSSKDFIISRQLSVNHFLNLRSSKKNQAKKDAGIIAGIDEKKFPFLRELICVDKEINALKSLFEAKNKTSTTISKSKNFEWDFDLIHIITHSDADTSNFYKNIIFLDDVELNNADIENLDIPAKLVTISSCSSGVGEYVEGEGSISLARAFFQAGTSAAVVSLWPVDDCTTAEFMTLFYKHLLEGERADEALANAQKDFLYTMHPKLEHPFYWTSFVLIGDPGPVFPKDNKPMVLGLLLAISGILIIPILGKQFRSKKKQAA